MGFQINFTDWYYNNNCMNNKNKNEFITITEIIYDENNSLLHVEKEHNIST